MAVSVSFWSKFGAKNGTDGGTRELPLLIPGVFSRILSKAKGPKSACTTTSIARVTLRQ